jgi:thiol-disulfide isomerase/thioredoxin
MPALAAEDVVVTFFWGDGCPHCAAEEPFLEDLARRHDGVRIEAFEVWGNAANRQRMAAVAEELGFDPTGVPVTVVGQDYWIGYSDQVAAEIEAAVVRALDARGEPAVRAGPPALPGAAPAPAAGAGQAVSVPLLGEVAVSSQPLVVSTAIIAFVDGFNPCSLWVLTVLLALVLRSQSRRKVLLVGATFLTVTAAVYGLFIVGVFGILSYIGFLPWIRAVVAVLALTFAAINIKDYFWFKRGPSLTIADKRKPGIYRAARRVRTLMEPDGSTAGLIGVTATMALGVSLVEFACTAGFPVIWSATLAAHEATAAVFAALLGLYLLIYLLDEFAVFGVAVVSLKATKLEERHGRVLKLIGGMIMLALGLVMAFAPTLMHSVAGSLAVFGAALAATAVILVVDRLVRPPEPPAGPSAQRRKAATVVR